MRKLFIYIVICVMSGALLLACQRDEGVQAGYEQGSDTYQPRTAPKAGAVPANTRPQEIRGELIRVDVERRTFSIRVETGMEQTFKFDDHTMVMGMEGAVPGRNPAAADGVARNRIRDLVGKDGSEVTVQWKEDGDAAKLASQVTVTQLGTAKPRNKAGKKK
jgi:hypothetical protein